MNFYTICNQLGNKVVNYVNPIAKPTATLFGIITFASMSANWLLPSIQIRSFSHSKKITAAFLTITTLFLVYYKTFNTQNKKQVKTNSDDKVIAKPKLQTITYNKEETKNYVEASPRMKALHQKLNKKADLKRTPSLTKFVIEKTTYTILNYTNEEAYITATCQLYVDGCPKEISPSNCEFNECQTFQQLCDFYDSNESECKNQFNNENYLIFRFYTSALNEKKQNFSNDKNLEMRTALVKRFGIYWAENIIENVLELGQEAVNDLELFFSDNGSMLISKNKEYQLIEKINSGQCDIEKYARIMNLYSIICIKDPEFPVDYGLDTISSEIITKLSEKSPALLNSIINKKPFKPIWDQLKFRIYSKISNQTLFTILKLLDASSPRPNHFCIPSSPEIFNEIAEEVNNKVKKIYLSSNCVFPIFTPKLKESIHLGGVCHGMTLHMAKKILKHWNNDSFTFYKEVQAIALKYFATSTRGVYISQTVYSIILNKEHLWQGYLQGVQSTLKEETPIIRTTILFLIAVAYGVSEEKIISFVQQNGFTGEDFTTMTLFYKEANKTQGHSAIALLKSQGVIDMDAFEKFTKEIGIDNPEKQNLIVRTLQGFYHARHRLKRKFTNKALEQGFEDKSKIIASQIVRFTEILNSSHNCAKTSNQALYSNHGLDLNPVTMHASDDSERWQCFVANAEDGVYRLCLPGHDLCLIKKENDIYNLDPNCLLLQNKSLMKFKCDNKQAIQAVYRSISNTYPINLKFPWEFWRISNIK